MDAKQAEDLQRSLELDSDPGYFANADFEAGEPGFASEIALCCIEEHVDFAPVASPT